MVGIISYSVTPEKNGWRLNFIYSGGFTLKNLQFLRYIFIKHIKVFKIFREVYMFDDNALTAVVYNMNCVITKI